MNTVFYLSFLVIISISSCVARDLLVGTSYNGRVIWQGKAEYYAIPFKKRVKEIFYSDPSQQIIKGIIARDLDHSEDATAILTAGGVGFPFANIRLKSERGSGLNYQIEIYA